MFSNLIITSEINIFNTNNRTQIKEYLCEKVFILFEKYYDYSLRGKINV